MKIYHLYHSGVAVVDGERLLVFDYYNDKATGNKRKLSTGVIDSSKLKRYSEVDVFVSHRHGDHYNPVIFNWQQENNNIKYFLSSDINATGDGNNVFYLDHDQELSIENLQIKTFGSTDLGVSFLVKIEDRSIFHAGDLNWWYWKSFLKEELEHEEREYKKEIEKIKGVKIDIAFVPVDPRLDEYYYLAGEYFIEEVKPGLFIPIHFGNKYRITSKLVRKLVGSSSKIAVINQRGDMIEFP